MRVVLQRVRSASVTIENTVVSSIEQGLLILLGIQAQDVADSIDYLVNKIVHLRIFEDEAGKMNRSVQEVQGSLLIVSQFTLYGDCQKGRRPNFMQAAAPNIAEPLYEQFVRKCREFGLNVQIGRFGAEMQVQLCNDGPVTILLEHPQID